MILRHDNINANLLLYQSLKRCNPSSSKDFLEGFTAFAEIFFNNIEECLLVFAFEIGISDVDTDIILNTSIEDFKAVLASSSVVNKSEYCEGCYHAVQVTLEMLQFLSIAVTNDTAA